MDSIIKIIEQTILKWEDSGEASRTAEARYIVETLEKQVLVEGFWIDKSQIKIISL